MKIKILNSENMKFVGATVEAKYSRMNSKQVLGFDVKGSERMKALGSKNLDNDFLYFIELVDAEVVSM